MKTVKLGANFDKRPYHGTGIYKVRKSNHNRAGDRVSRILGPRTKAKFIVSMLRTRNNGRLVRTINKVLIVALYPICVLTGRAVLWPDQVGGLC